MVYKYTTSLDYLLTVTDGANCEILRAHFATRGDAKIAFDYLFANSKGGLTLELWDAYERELIKTANTTTK